MQSAGRSAPVVIGAQQEYFAPLGKVVLPDGAIFAPGSPALAIHPEARPAAGEPVLQKHLPGAFTSTPLEQLRRERGVQRVIVAGFMTQMCVDTTSRQAAHLGFAVTVLSDATAAMAVKAPDGVVIPADQVHRTRLGSLQGFRAEIRRVEDPEAAGAARGG